MREWRDTIAIILNGKVFRKERNNLVEIIDKQLVGKFSSKTPCFEGVEEAVSLGAGPLEPGEHRCEFQFSLTDPWCQKG